MFGFGPNSNEQLCGECLKEHPAFEKASAYGSYDGGLRELIHLLKYDRVRSAATVLGRMLAEAITDLRPHFAPAGTLPVPVPLHASKLRSRGFNQSELIAEAALKGNLDLRLLQLRPQLLKRVRATESQTGLTREQRRENIRGAFAVTSDEVRGRDILVVRRRSYYWHHCGRMCTSSAQCRRRTRLGRDRCAGNETGDDRSNHAGAATGGGVDDVSACRLNHGSKNSQFRA